MTGALFGWAVALASSASAQSLLDRIRTPLPASANGPPKRTPTRPDPSSGDPEPATDDPVAAPTAEPGAADDPVERQPTAEPESGAMDSVADADPLEAARSPVGLEPTDRSAGPAITAGLRAATAYANRGLNAFGPGAGVLAPSLEVEAGRWSGGWTGLFQAYGPDRARLVRDAVGHEQDAWVGFALVGGERLQVDLAAWAIGYPFAAGSLPVVFEPGVTATLDVGLDLTAAVLQSQVVGDDAASYTYGQLGLGRTVDLADHLALELAATAGGKRWNVEPRARPNTWDVDLAGGLDLGTARFTVRPTAHLTWSDLASSDRAFGWAAVDTTFTP